MSANQTTPVIEANYKIETYSWMAPVQAGLEAVERRLAATPAGQHEWLSMVTRHLLCSGGKRIRPAISLLACGIFGVDPGRSVSLAAGIEMLHTATLVHDDLIDHANQRRGKPTINSISGGDAAVLIGDYLFARAANLVADTDSVRVMNDFARTLMVILNGEVVQRFSRWEMSLEAYSQRIYAKTGALFVLAAQAGAVLGETGPALEAALVEFGRAVGTAFQIVDDVLDYTADSSHIGKPAGGDLRQGLVTLPLISYLEQYPDDPDFSELLTNRNGEHPATDRLVEKVRHSEAIPAALATARAEIAAAQAALKMLPLSIYTHALSDLAHTVVDRSL